LSVQMDLFYLRSFNSPKLSKNEKLVQSYC